jgi:hypothetical protein
MEPLGFAEQVAAGGSDPMKSFFFIVAESFE